MKKSNYPTFILAILFCSVVVGIIVFPGEAVKAAYEGLTLWFNVVCPSLLPFFICIEILIGLGIVSFLGSAFRSLMRPVFNLPGEAAFAFLMSISSGYPVGAKITAKLRSEKICTRIEGQRMLSLCSTSGPLFIIGAVATGIMNNSALGFLLAFSHYLSAIAVGLCFRFYGKGNMSQQTRLRDTTPLADMLAYREKDGRTIGALLGDAVRNGINLILLIGGFIIFFAVITRILKLSGILGFLSRLIAFAFRFSGIQADTVSSLLVGILEVTNGIKECAALRTPLPAQLTAVSFMIGFGGLSVNAQVLSIIADTDLNVRLYLAAKVVQGFFAALFTSLLYPIINSVQVFNLYISRFTVPTSAGPEYVNWLSAFVHSALYLVIGMALLFLAVLTKGLKKIRR